MTGTEKQIAYAEDIRTHLNGIISETMERIDAEEQAHPEQADKAAKARAMVNGISERINSFAGYAGFLIDTFKDARDFRGIQVSIRLFDTERKFH